MIRTGYRVCPLGRDFKAERQGSADRISDSDFGVEEQECRKLLENAPAATEPTHVPRPANHTGDSGVCSCTYYLIRGAASAGDPTCDAPHRDASRSERGGGCDLPSRPGAE